MTAAATAVCTLDDVGSLPPVLDLPTAAQLLGIGRTAAYALARRGAFPAPVLRIGKLYRVPAAGLLEVLGLTHPATAKTSPGPVDSAPDHPAPACAPAPSRASIHPTC
jgi:predicted DNA-binding transcriptional regulator AlpA